MMLETHVHVNFRPRRPKRTGTDSYRSDMGDIRLGRVGWTLGISSV